MIWKFHMLSILDLQTNENAVCQEIFVEIKFL